MKIEGENMKKWITLLAAAVLSLLFAVTNAYPQAQGGASNAQKLDKLEAMAKQLNLTPAQKAKFIPILKAEAPKLQAIKDNTSLTKLQKLEQLRALREQTNPQIQAILTPQQYEQFQGIRQQEMERYIQKMRSQQ
jgi:periplasmic protein CpxP/Spy